MWPPRRSAGSFDTERMLHWIYEAGGLGMQRQFRDDTEGVYSTVLFIRTGVHDLRRAPACCS